MQKINAAIIAIVIVAIVGVAALLLIDSPDNESSAVTGDDIKGHWYCNEIYRVDTNDDFMILDKDNYPSIREYDVDFYSIIDGKFYGLFNGQPMSGIFDPSVITFYGYLHGEYSKYIAYNITKTTLIFANTHVVYNNHGEQIGTEAWLISYTKELPLETMNIHTGWTNIYGKWNSINDVMYSNGTYEKFGSAYLMITEQNENMISGTMNNYIDGYEVLNFKGIIGYKNDRCSGIGIDETGRIWTILLTDSNLALVTTDNDGRYDYPNNTASIRLTYSQTGKITGTTVYMDLKGTKWINTNTAAIDCYGKITNEAPLFILEFDAQYGNMASGISKYSTRITDVSIQLMDKNGLKLQIAWDEYHTDICQNYGWIEDDIMYIVEYDYTQSVPAAKYYILEKMTDEEVDLIGHWYNCSMIGYDMGVLVEKNTFENPEIESNDFDIYGITEGLFYGKMFGFNVSGSYVNGIVYVVDIVGNRGLHMKGWFEGSTLMAMISYIDNVDGKDIQILGNYAYRQTRSAVAFETVDADIEGTWELYDGFALSVGSERKEIYGKILEITDYNSGMFKGSIEETSDTYDFVGILAYGHDDNVEGVIIDSMNNWWQFVIGEDSITLYAISANHIVDGENEYNTICRIYSRGGTTPVIEQLIDLNNIEFTVVSVNRIDSSGNIVALSRDFQYTSCNQILNSITCIIQSTPYDIPTVAYAYEMSDMIALRILFDNALMDGPCLGNCWIGNGVAYIVSDFYIDGIAYTTLISLEPRGNSN